MEFIAQGFAQALVLLAEQDPETWSAIEVTLRLTALSMTVALVLGLPLGILVGTRNFPGRSLVRVVVDTCLALPTVVVGLLVYAFISRQGPLGSLDLLFTLRGMAIGQAILALPIVIALTASALEGADPRMLMTLQTLGTPPGRMVLGLLREVRYAVLAAAVTAYGRVVAEVGVSMMLGGNIKWHTRTITTAITLETGKGEFSMGIALGLVLLGISFALNGALSLFRRRASA
ncbi:MAG: ABC transporter permease [Synergistales bacterium]|jgi:tungstate transport system permease protein